MLRHVGPFTFKSTGEHAPETGCVGACVLDAAIAEAVHHELGGEPVGKRDDSGRRSSGRGGKASAHVSRRKRDLTREQLYDLVWSKAMRLIAKDLGKSDVAVAKTCRQAAVPVPPRGYWNRVQAGKRVVRAKLPPRFPGASNEVRLKHPDYPDAVSDEPPSFAEPVEEVARRAAAIVGKVKPLRNDEAQHPIVVDLLKLEREDYFVQQGLRPAPSDAAFRAPPPRSRASRPRLQR